MAKESKKKPATKKATQQRKHVQKKMLQQKRRLNIWYGLGPALIVLALIFGGYATIQSWLIQHPKQKNSITDTPVTPTPEPLITGTPSQLQIPSVNINLRVIPGYYNPASKSWTLSLNDAQWGVGTMKPNNKSGLTFIYAHYRKNVFYNLPRVQPGATVTLSTEEGRIFSYVYRNSTTVDPSDTSILDYKGKPILVLQTCSGVWFENRQLFIFDYSGVK